MSARESGVFILQGNKPLTGGIYMIVGQKKKKLFEFVINKNQKFSLTTDTANFPLDMEVKNSPENQLFFKYLKFNDQQFKKSLDLDKQRKKLKQ